MKYLRWIAGLLIVAAVPLVAVAHVAQAQRFGGSTQSGEVVEGNFYSRGKSITIDGTINGDVFCAGQTVVIHAVINGDVICMAKDLVLTGRVNGNVRVAAQTVVIDSVIQRSATVAAQDFSLDSDSRVGRDLTSGAKQQSLKGLIARDAIVGGTSVVLNGTVGRNMVADSNQLEIKDRGRIGGNLNYTSSNKPILNGGASIRGQVKQTTKAPKRSMFAGFIIYAYLFLLCGLLLVGLLLVFAFPRFMQVTNGIVRHRFGRALLVGIVASAVFPMLIVLLSVTLVGLPVAIVLLFAWLLAMALSGPIVGYAVGRALLGRKTKSRLLMMIVGGIITATIYLIPFAGLLLLLVAYWLGLGGLLLGVQRFRTNSEPLPAD
jgi:cytoskeletal protein CcmA (bactofilin family)